MYLPHYRGCGEVMVAAMFVMMTMPRGGGRSGSEDHYGDDKTGDDMLANTCP